MNTQFATNTEEKRERVPDPYEATPEPIEPALCPICFAVFKEGRWQWAAWWPINAHKQLCPACHRARDNCPAGTVTIRGEFAIRHRAEILNLVRRQEQQEKCQHPLRRIMGIEEKNNSMVIKTTDINLPRSIGSALRNTYEGDLEVSSPRRSYSVQVTWRSRD